MEAIAPSQSKFLYNAIMNYKLSSFNIRIPAMLNNNFKFNLTHPPETIKSRDTVFTLVVRIGVVDRIFAIITLSLSGFTWIFFSRD